MTAPKSGVTGGTRRSRLSDAAIALSLANLIAAKIWAETLMDEGMADLLTRADHLVGILNTLLIATALWLGIRVVRRLPRPWGLAVANVACALLLACIAYATSHVVWPDAAWLAGASTRTTCLVGALSLAAVVLLAVRRPRLMARTMTAAILLLLPFVAMTFSQALWRAATHSPRPVFAPSPPASRALAPSAARRSRSRVVVLLFDEMDQRLTFIDRPATLKLPELDRLCSQSIACGNVFPPARDTLQSVPAMLTGRLVGYGRLQSSDGLLIGFAGEDRRIYLDQCRTFFHDARQSGYRTAISTGVLQYERLVPGQAEYVSPRLPGRRSLSFAAAFWRQWRGILCTLPLSTRLRVGERLPSGVDLDAYIEGFGAFMEDTVNVLAAEQFDLIWVHLTIPHDPPIYDRFRGAYSSSRSPALDYFDSLALVDRTLGEFRSALEAAGLWESGTLLVLSDHWYRISPTEPGQKRDHRVPYILKLPGQQQGVRYDRPFNGLVTHDLIPALLRGELKQPEDAVAWLGRHRTFAESPLTVEVP